MLFTSWLFQRIVPPVLPFALGSLGFLTNFDFADHQAVMDNAIDSGIMHVEVVAPRSGAQPLSPVQVKSRHETGPRMT